MASLATFMKFLALVIILNLLRYTYAYLPIEGAVFGPLILAIGINPEYFNMNFTTFDWTTSYFYNFMLWLTITWVYFYLHPAFNGNHIVKSLKIYGIFWVLFASISAIYMNHYSHPKDFYLWNILDALLVFPFVALGNGLLFPRIFNIRKENQ
jgi:hypothetical protein